VQQKSSHRDIFTTGPDDFQAWVALDADFGGPWKTGYVFSTISSF